MKKVFITLYLSLMAIIMLAGTHFQHTVPPISTSIEQPEKPISPCVKALLDGEEIDDANLNKNSEGTLQVENEKDKVYFNLVLKSYIGNEQPPLYLRFTKVDRLDIQKVLKYANIGDEIFIEPYTIDGFKCLPSHFVVT